MSAQLQGHYFLSFLFLLVSLGTHAVTPHTVRAIINAGINPAAIAVTPDNRFAYVANTNNYSLAGEDTVSVLNLTTNTLDQTITSTSFQQPYRVAINADGTQVYVTNSASTTVSIINTATRSVEGIIDGFDGPSGIVIAPTGDRAYVNNYGCDAGVGSGNSTTIRVVDLKTNTIEGEPIIVGLAPAALAITPNGEFLYVVNYVDGKAGTGTISVVQTSDNTVVYTITGFSGPFAIAITPDGKYAYVTNFGSNDFAPIGTTVSVVDLSNNTVTATINLGIQPAGIAITPDGRRAYATNYNTLYASAEFKNLTAGQGTVNIIDIATHTVMNPAIAVGHSPSSITIASDGKHAYVTHFTYNSVSVIALS